MSNGKVSGFKYKFTAVIKPFGPEEGARRTYQGGPKFNARKNISAFTMSTAGLVGCAIFFPFALQLYESAKYPSLNVREKHDSITGISRSEIIAIENDDSLSPSEKSAKKAEVYRTEREALASLKSDLKETTIKSSPEGKSSSNSDSLEKKVDTKPFYFQGILDRIWGAGKSGGTK